jgi:hypothetical protein
MSRVDFLLIRSLATRQRYFSGLSEDCWQGSFDNTMWAGRLTSGGYYKMIEKENFHA